MSLTKRRLSWRILCGDRTLMSVRQHPSANYSITTAIWSFLVIFVGSLGSGIFHCTSEVKPNMFPEYSALTHFRRLVCGCQSHSELERLQEFLWHFFVLWYPFFTHYLTCTWVWRRGNFGLHLSVAHSNCIVPCNMLNNSLVIMGRHSLQFFLLLANTLNSRQTCSNMRDCMFTSKTCWI
jgi:hypothetical protein